MSRLAEHRLAARMDTIAPFRVVEVMEKAWEVQATGRSVIQLVVGEPDFGTPAPVVDAASRAIAGGQVRYTSSLGIRQLREAISGYYAERFGADVPASRIVVTTGGSAALLLAFGATLDAGDQVLMSDPGYPCNRNLIRLYGAEPVAARVGPGDNYQLSIEAAARLWTDQTRGLLLGTPSNPTGTAIPAGDLAELIRWTASQDALCFIDEVYGELVYDTAPSTALSSSQDVFVVNSFSKTFGMTGWRLGWLVCPEWAMDAVTRLAQNVYISPPVPAQFGALAAFTPAVWAIVEERRRLFQERRDLLVGGLRELGFGVPVMPQGAFYVYARCDRFATDSSEFVNRLLNEAGVAVAPGEDFGVFDAEHHVRFSYAASLEQLHEALFRLDCFARR
ncbi:MAG: aminotransferase class I/II-fold pyridoxal phosphate-dependent enzyme [Solirubrobacteraceae bacterium]